MSLELRDISSFSYENDLIDILNELFDEKVFILMADLASIYASSFPNLSPFTLTLLRIIFSVDTLYIQMVHTESTLFDNYTQNIKLAIRGSFSIHIYLSPDSLVVVKLGC